MKSVQTSSHFLKRTAAAQGNFHLKKIVQPTKSAVDNLYINMFMHDIRCRHDAAGRTMTRPIAVYIFPFLLNLVFRSIYDRRDISADVLTF